MAECIFLGRDSVTKGDWHDGTQLFYGKDGYRVIAGASSQTHINHPSYVSAFSQINSVFTWTNNPTIVGQAILPPPPATTKYKSAWYRATNLPIQVTISDSDWHQVAIYAFDDSVSGRKQTFNIIDPGTSAVLNTQSITVSAEFVLGHWWVWAIKGSFNVNLVQDGTFNALYSAICFDPYNADYIGGSMNNRGDYIL